MLAVPSPSGSEWQVAAVVRAKLIDWGYAPETDAAGNVLVRLAGAEAGPLLCLAAHMDEIGVRGPRPGGGVPRKDRHARATERVTSLPQIWVKLEAGDAHADVLASSSPINLAYRSD